MKKLPAFVIVAFVFVSRVGAIEMGTPSLALHLSPGVQVPLGASADYFTVGGQLDVLGELDLTEDPTIFVSAGVEYLLSPLRSGQSISALAGDLGGGLAIDITSRLSLRASASVGYNLSFLNGTGSYTGTGVTSGSSLHAAAGLKLGYLLSPSLNLGLGVGYGSCLGLTNGISLSLGSSWYFTGTEARRAKIEQGLPSRPQGLRSARTPDPGKGVRMSDIGIQEVFPVFHKYYDDHPMGTAVLFNQEKQPVTDLTVTLYIKQYMDAPKDCRAPQQLAPGETAKIGLFGLFTDKVLEITEGTKTAAEITLEYRLRGAWYREIRQETVSLYDRNAMSWDDDRRAAAFVTAKDPSVMAFAKNVASALGNDRIHAFDEKLEQAMAIHEALTLHGVHYVVDPKTPYTEYSKDAAVADYLQFPRQTLEYRAGDCDDLSILYTALLESVGVETAFITVPGHIFAAFSLDMPPDEVKKSLADPQDVIFLGGSTWVPVEVTEREAGFTKAWEKGAKQWRDYLATGQAKLYPMRDSWAVYVPVGIPGAPGELDVPAGSRIVAAAQKEMLRFVQRELDPQVKKLEAEIKKTGTNPALQNRLGVLYARYGFADKAQAEFQKILARQEYAPALVNLGNLAFLQESWEKALEYYQRAAKKATDSAVAQLSIARTQYQLGNYGMVKKAFDQVKTLQPELAAKYSYLESRDEQSTRAGEVNAHGAVPWQD